MKNTLVLRLCLLATPALAEGPAHAREIIRQLQSLGYQAELEGGDQIRATHGDRLNLQLKDFRGGILVASYFGHKPDAGKHRSGFLEVVNRLNRGAVAARFYIDEDGDLAIEGWYPGEYEPERFAVFLRAFDDERDNLVRNLDRLGRYIE